MSYYISNSERFVLHICRLLECFDEAEALARECLAAIRQSEVLFHPGGELPTFHTFQIYKTRALLQQSQSSVTGYPQLLDALEREREPSIRLISIATGQGTFLLFTCVQAQRLIGLLKSGRTLEEFQSALDSYRHTALDVLETAADQRPEVV